jgi:hypothetical protein
MEASWSEAEINSYYRVTRLLRTRHIYLHGIVRNLKGGIYGYGILRHIVVGLHIHLPLIYGKKDGQHPSNENTDDCRCSP